MWRHIIESHSTPFDVLRVLCFLAYFTISVFYYTYWPCFEVKDEEDLALGEDLSTEPVEAKDRVNDYETCESDEWLQRPVILCTKRREA